MKKILILLLVFFSFNSYSQNLKSIFKYSTFYGAINGGTSISDVDIYSVTNGLETNTVKTPFDYSITLGIRKIARMGYEPKENFDTGIAKTVEWYLDNEVWWKSVMDGSYQK